MRSFPAWLLRLIFHVDDFCLMAGYKLVVFLCEWLSITRNIIERGLIALAVLLLSSGAGLEFMRHTLPWRLAGCLHLVLVCMFTFALLHSHRRTDRQRALLLLYVPAIVMRPLISLVYVLLASLQLAPKTAPNDICIAAGFILWPIAEYIMATGGGNDGRGRRRKEALGKLKDKLRQAVAVPAPAAGAAFTTLGKTFALFPQRHGVAASPR